MNAGRLHDTSKIHEKKVLQDSSYKIVDENCVTKWLSGVANRQLWKMILTVHRDPPRTSSAGHSAHYQAHVVLDCMV